METKHQVEASEIVNLLPFVSMPEQLSIIRLRTALRFKPQSLDLARAGTFIHNGDEIWSFTPLPILVALFEAIMDPGASRTRPRFEIESVAPGRNVLSWLLRKHFERYLLRFAAKGLFIEGDPNAPRAYFQGQDGKPRTIAYNTRESVEVSRNVVVQRCGGRRPWFKNEGLGYQVMALGGVWGVAIDPFYIFTGADAKKPLPFAAQIERSSRWNGRDAKTGATHLTFWEDFLTLGAPLVDLRQENVDNLFLGRSLLQLPRRSAI
ncbi:MAG: hypothetical protein JO137_06460 [Hyphomicrobiales bacterium]|nr:hypothetical protein [Hyphomicrobiales bacterium]MBV9739559.1 hypothetical protein [Hyphomicrobiales bacterium]